MDQNTTFKDVQIVLGSPHDRPVLDESKLLQALGKMGFEWDLSYISADRNPEELEKYCVSAAENGAKVFIAAAGLNPALPGAIAAITRTVPVIGIALNSSTIPAYVTIACAVARPEGSTVLWAGIGKNGLTNAAFIVAQMFGINDAAVRHVLDQYLKEFNPPPKIHVETSSDQE
ncbi:MAG: AIR carboxylase family protein [Patescibacteria group bacterium]